MLDQYVTGNFPTAELPQINRTLVVSLQGLDAVMPTVGNRVDLTDYKIGRLHGKLSAPALRKLLVCLYTFLTWWQTRAFVRSLRKSPWPTKNPLNF